MVNKEQKINFLEEAIRDQEATFKATLKKVATHLRESADEIDRLVDLYPDNHIDAVSSVMNRLAFTSANAFTPIQNALTIFKMMEGYKQAVNDLKKEVANDDN